MTVLPSPRGPLSDHLLGALEHPPHTLAPVTVVDVEDPLGDEDLQLALYLCYELHYRGLPGVDDRWEWDPSLLGFRAELEQAFRRGVEEMTGPFGAPEEPVAPEAMDLALRAVADLDDGPSLSVHVERDATRDQVLEFIVHRSASQLKEADPHSWVIPRLSGPPKAALVEIQADEYGGGRPERIHAQLYADTMDALGLDSRYGAYLEHIPGATLATVNLVSLLGLHRRTRAAVVGHLAFYEMTSSVPSRRYAKGLRRLGFGPAATGFFDEHVVADAVHENIAAIDLAGGLVRQDPAMAAEILWGARALVAVEGRWARAVFGAWEAGESSLRVPLEAVATA